MKANIVDMVVSLRDGFNGWWSTFSKVLVGSSTFENIVIVIYAVYVFALLGYIIDATKEGREQGDYSRGLIAVFKTVISLLAIYCFGLAVVFVFPGSEFVLSLKKMINGYYTYPILGVSILLICGIIAYICGIFFVYIDIIYKKISKRR